MTLSLSAWQYASDGTVVVTLEDGTQRVELHLSPHCPPTLASKTRPVAAKAVTGQRRPPQKSQLHLNGVNLTCVFGSSSESDEEAETESETDSSSTEKDRQSVLPAFPAHGAVLELRALAQLEQSPFLAVTTELQQLGLPAGQFSRRFILLGYDETKRSAFLAADPLLLRPDTGQGSRFQPLPVVELSDVALLQSLAFHDITAELLQATPSDPGRRVWRAPVVLGLETVQSPVLDASLLGPVFGVQVQREYYLTSINRYVEFVGVAAGLPWVQFLASDEGKPARSAVAPLPLCHREKDLLERFQLCDGITPADAATAPRPGRLPKKGSNSRSASHASGRETPTAYTPRRPCILGKRTSSPRPVPYATTDASPTVTVTGPFGNQIHCQKDARRAFGLSFPDRLVGSEALKLGEWKRLLGGAGKGLREGFGGKAATVMGLYNNDLVLLFDGHQKATILRSRTTQKEVCAVFAALPPDTPPPASSSVALSAVPRAEKAILAAEGDAAPAPNSERDLPRSRSSSLAGHDATSPSTALQPVPAHNENVNHSLSQFRSPSYSSEVAGASATDPARGVRRSPSPAAAVPSNDDPVPTVHRVVFGSATATISMSQGRERTDPCAPFLDLEFAPPSPPSSLDPVKAVGDTKTRGSSSSADQAASSGASHTPLYTFSSSPLLNFLKAYAAFHLQSSTTSPSIDDIGNFYKSHVQRFVKAYDRFQFYRSKMDLSGMMVEEFQEVLSFHEANGEA